MNVGTNNCATCDYSKYEHEGGHCYMFREEPQGACMQHTGRRRIAIITGGEGLGSAMDAIRDLLRRDEEK
jgi:hypothetical protein